MKRTEKWATVMALGGAVALALCIILTVNSLSASSLPGCTGDSGCNTVLGSRWSKLLGFLPVGALGAGMYLSLIICLVSLAFWKDPEIEALCGKILLGGCSAIILASLWFIILQFWKVGALCPYCMATHCIGIILSVLIIIHLWNKDGLSHRTALAWCGGGALSAIALIAVQLLTTPPSDYEGGASPDDLPHFNVGEAPFIGDPANPAISVLFDYQCPHCLRVHSWLEEISSENNLSFILCATPLSTACNPYIPQGQDRYKGSCELARLSLAVWKTDPAAFKDFDSWLFGKGGGKWPRTPQEAREKALGLVDADALGKEMESEWMQAYLDKSLELFGRTTREGHSGIPRLVLGNTWIIPEADSKEALLEVIQDALLGEN